MKLPPPLSLRLRVRHAKLSPGPSLLRRPKGASYLREQRPRY